eukprot:TRINITY_DN8412_c0_g1_i1.p1 TRINITY_DN8412_c0_g1~~TRINITY_DN8412_c0_g1_i1.p1  ORF type:complete len:437 (+),score=103.30 TRINITY_DN8412_c0_g1_i1:59-1369(+)
MLIAQLKKRRRAKRTMQQNRDSSSIALISRIASVLNDASENVNTNRNQEQIAVDPWTWKNESSLEDQFNAEEMLKPRAFQSLKNPPSLIESNKDAKSAEDHHDKDYQDQDYYDQDYHDEENHDENYHDEEYQDEENQDQDYNDQDYHDEDYYDEQYDFQQERERKMKTNDRKGYAEFKPWCKSNYKYWLQRYRLFSRYDEGIRMDQEMWYSVTPEKIAQHIAERCRTNVVIDAFCGAGGNSIQFAMTCQKVIAIDIDENKLRDARHNAQIYGVADKIEFRLGNFLELGPTLEADLIFLSPPWGGPSYLQETIFDIEQMNPKGSDIFQLASKISRNIILYMPRNTSFAQLVALNSENDRCEIELNLLSGRYKTITAYYGEIARPSYSATSVSKAQAKHFSSVDVLESFSVAKNPDSHGDECLIEEILEDAIPLSESE